MNISFYILIALKKNLKVLSIFVGNIFCYKKRKNSSNILNFIFAKLTYFNDGSRTSAGVPNVGVYKRRSVKILI